MLVSLFTDASHCPDTKVGGWGAWAKCELGQVQGGGPMKREVATSTVAEARAVFGGLLLISKQVWWPCIKIVLVQTDNKTVVEALERKGPPEEDRIRWRSNFIIHVTEFKKLHGIEIKGRWIRGHQASVTPRNWVNNLTDRLAKKGLNEARVWYRQKQKLVKGVK